MELCSSEQNSTNKLRTDWNKSWPKAVAFKAANGSIWDAFVGAQTAHWIATTFSTPFLEMRQSQKQAIWQSSKQHIPWLSLWRIAFQQLKKKHAQRENSTTEKYKSYGHQCFPTDKQNNTKRIPWWPQPMKLSEHITGIWNSLYLTSPLANQAQYCPY